jgi:hypothetical protein
MTVMTVSMVESATVGLSLKSNLLISFSGTGRLVEQQGADTLLIPVIYHDREYCTRVPRSDICLTSSNDEWSHEFSAKMEYGHLSNHTPSVNDTLPTVSKKAKKSHASRVPLQLTHSRRL